MKARSQFSIFTPQFVRSSLGTPPGRGALRDWMAFSGAPVRR